MSSYSPQEHTKTHICFSRVQCFNKHIDFAEVVKWKLKCTTAAGVWDLSTRIVGAFVLFELELFVHNLRKHHRACSPSELTNPAQGYSGLVIL